MEFVKIQDSDSLVRDLSSGAVINTNTTDYQNYLARKNSSKDMKQQIKQNADKIKQIESDVSEIKQLLITLINKER
jgi:wobble nucleotide-excising tRNase